MKSGKLKVDKKFVLGFAVGIGIVVVLGIGIVIGLKLKKTTTSKREEIAPVQEIETETEPYLKTYTFTAKNYVSSDRSLRKFTFNYSPDLEVVVHDPDKGSRRIRLKPVGEDVHDSYYISVDEPGQSLGEGIVIDKQGEMAWLGSNKYTKHNVYYQPTNEVVMIIYDPQPPLELGDIYISWWDKNRKQESLDHAEIILKSLKHAD